MTSLDLDAYFARIGYDGAREPTLGTLTAISAAHVQSIPFENLDVLLGRPIALEPEALLQKLVVDRRGGYCFEQNGLLLEVLGALGFAVTPLAARVRLGQPRSFTPARTHLCVKVVLAGEPWIADVGVGSSSLTAPIRFVADLEQTTSHDTRRLVQEDGRWFHQIRYGAEWNDVYELTGEEMPFIDRVVASWYTSAHPGSHFKNRLLAARALPGGRRLGLLNDELTLREHDGRGTTTKIQSDEELLALLARHFDLRFPAGTRFGDFISARPA